MVEVINLNKNEFHMLDGLSVKTFGNWNGNWNGSTLTQKVYEELDGVTLHIKETKVYPFVLYSDGDRVTHFNRIKIYRMSAESMYRIGFWQNRKHFMKVHFPINEDILSYILRERTINSVLD
jgi:hypothetical protein